jgi:hypothetical protein
MFASVAALSGLALLLIAAARRLRGWTSYADVFFPMALLHLGHEWNVLEGWNIQNVAVGVLLGGYLLAIACHVGLLTVSRALAAGTILVLLPMNGAAGVVVLWPLAAWLFWAGLCAFRSGGTYRWAGSCGMVLAIVGAMMVPLYLYHLPAYPLPHSRLAGSSYGALMFLSTAWGPGTAVWPISGYLVVPFLLWALIALVLAAWRRGDDRLRAVGLLLFIGAMGMLALAVGWGRSSIKDLCLHARYGLLALPALLAVYMAGFFYRQPGIGAFMQMLLCASFSFVLPLDIEDAISWGEKHRKAWAAFERDLEAGVPCRFLVGRYRWLVPAWEETDFSAKNDAWVRGEIESLARARIGPYKGLRPLPPYRQVQLDIVPAALNDMAWQGKVGRGYGSNPYVEFELKPPRHVYGVVITCTLNYGDAEAAPTDFLVSWRNGRSGRWIASTQTGGVDTSQRPAQRGFWIDDDIDGIRIRPDKKACVITISRIVLLVPAEPTEH